MSRAMKRLRCVMAQATRLEQRSFYPTTWTEFGGVANADREWKPMMRLMATATAWTKKGDECEWLICHKFQNTNVLIMRPLQPDTVVSSSMVSVTHLC